ncbi:SIP domain-containing protein [Arthrobacter roseus]|uniref:SIP domain-containing protein n=1 Tax=Arthrobacter roseus TaxID=136274 RepID=UPI001962B716|nr:SIP domain-containing protein [Arthrobacter roseus]MBM7849744.1 iron complex transport system ATP-binding protein [Arthrobacter roseus]
MTVESEKKVSTGQDAGRGEEARLLPSNQETVEAASADRAVSGRSLKAEKLTLAYDDHTVVHDLTVELPPGQVTVIVGANACGKSTLLRGLARLLKPASGTVMLDGRDIHSLPTKQVARTLGLLPQTPSAPDGITVADLVGRGRYPHQGWFRQWTPGDDAAVASALEATDTLELAERCVDELSGGQRQRVWIAMALAQETDILLLDEPTTFLDVAHQVEVLDLVFDLNRRTGTTVAIVLHDLNLAARYADHLIAMCKGSIIAQGAPADVVTEENVSRIFGLQSSVITDPVSGTPMVIPEGRHHRRPEQTKPSPTKSGPAKPRPVNAVGCFDVTVKCVERLGPNFRRVTFTGMDLAGFGVRGDTLDLRIKLIIPVQDRAPFDLKALIAESEDAGAGWYQTWLQVDPEVRGAMRTYTVREHRIVDGEHELDVDFVMHFDELGKGGPASQWAIKAAPGDTLSVIGPNIGAANCSTAGAYGGIEWSPGLAQRVLLAGDETAVPAIAAILESLPADMTGNAILEVPEPADFQDVRTPSGVEVTWLARGERPHGELLDAAVRRAVVLPGWAAVGRTPSASVKAGLPLGREPEFVDVDQAILWETPQRLDQAAIEATPNPDMPAGALPFYAWIAGEAAVVRELRRYLVRDVGIDRKQVAFMGYWRKGKSEA